MPYVARSLCQWCGVISLERQPFGMYLAHSQDCEAPLRSSFQPRCEAITVFTPNGSSNDNKSRDNLFIVTTAGVSQRGDVYDQGNEDNNLERPIPSHVVYLYAIETISSPRIGSFACGALRTRDDVCGRHYRHDSVGTCSLMEYRVSE